MEKKISLKEYRKLFELNAKEHTVKILAKEYKKTKDGDTLCALYFALKQCKNDFESFEKLVIHLDKAGLINNISDFAGSCGDKEFSLAVKTKVADIKLADFYAQREQN